MKRNCKVADAQFFVRLLVRVGLIAKTLLAQQMLKLANELDPDAVDASWN
jgi:hypothetical protein